MAQSGVRVVGLKETVRDLQKLGVEVSDLKETFGDIAAAGARYASSFAPSRSGKLARTIRGNKAKNIARVMAGRARVRYAGPINYGWQKRGIKASHFMQRADKALQPDAVKMLEAGLDRAIRKAGLTE